MKLLALKQMLIRKRGHKCECCGRPATVLHGHHCLIHNKAGYPILTTGENIELVCEECHSSGIVNGHRHRAAFLLKQRKRYDMREWISKVESKGLVVEPWLKI